MSTHEIERPVADVSSLQKFLAGRAPVEIRCGSNGIVPKAKDSLKPSKSETPVVAATSKLLPVCKE